MAGCWEPPVTVSACAPVVHWPLVQSLCSKKMAVAGTLQITATFTSVLRVSFCRTNVTFCPHLVDFTRPFPTRVYFLHLPNYLSTCTLGPPILSFTLPILLLQFILSMMLFTCSSISISHTFWTDTAIRAFNKLNNTHINKFHIILDANFK